MYTLHLFIHLSIDGNLGCFYPWAIVNNAAVNMCSLLNTKLIYSPFLKTL